MKKNHSHLTSLVSLSSSLILSAGAWANPKTCVAAQAQIVLIKSEKRMDAVALRYHDRSYIMVDKLRGRLIVFEKGNPIFTAPVLTGESVADVIPERTFHISLKQHRQADKVTPAGRFTVSRADNVSYGGTLTVNEVYGDSWLEAIHICKGSACLALHSKNTADSHRTLGCVNVDPKTMEYLLRWSKDRTNTPLYIMPERPSDISYFFRTLPATLSP